MKTISQIFRLELLPLISPIGFILNYIFQDKVSILPRISTYSYLSVCILIWAYYRSCCEAEAVTWPRCSCHSDLGDPEVNINHSEDEDEERKDDDEDEELEIGEDILVDIWVVRNVIRDEVAQERQGEEWIWRKERVFLWLICIATVWNLVAFSDEAL